MQELINAITTAADARNNAGAAISEASQLWQSIIGRLVNGHRDYEKNGPCITDGLGLASRSFGEVRGGSLGLESWLAESVAELERVAAAESQIAEDCARVVEALRQCERTQ